MAENEGKLSEHDCIVSGDGFKKHNPLIERNFKRKS